MAVLNVKGHKLIRIPINKWRNIIRKMFRDNRGVTLIELILIISILSILLFIPAFNGSNVLKYKERKELREFKNDINYARNRAVVESILYGIEIRTNSNTYLINKYSKFPEIIKKKEFTSGIKVKSTNIKDNELIFNYSGAPKDAGTIYLENSKGNKIRITINLATGKVNIYFD